MDSTGSLAYSTLYIGLTSDGKSYCVPRADVYPEYNNYYNLGTSTNQWKSVYSQTYYYNGTQWGLDKSNVWTGTQTIEQSTFAQLRLKNSTVRMGDAIPSSQKTVGAVTFSDSNNSNMGFVDFRDSTQGNTFVRIIARQKYDANGDRSTSGTIYESGIDVGVLNDKTPYVAPTSNAAAQLGTSTNKWKTLNGINPGALSLPQGGNSTAISVDITEWYVQDPAYPDDPTELILDETEHVVTTSVPGWLRVTFPNVAGNYAYARQYQAGANMADEKIATGISEFTGVNFIFPIHDALVVKIKAKSASVTIYPCMGNV